MLNATYVISYNKQLHRLEFKHEFFSNSSISPLESLFNDFWVILDKIIFDAYHLAVGRIDYCNFDYTVYHSIFYTGDIQYNEKITDILFLHGKYRYYINHHPSFLTQAKLAYWQNAIKNVDKPVLLKMLYEDNKISEAYLLKHSVYNPSSLYELGMYSLINNLCRNEGVQTEKVDELPLPRSIKEDIKLSFSRS